MDYDKPIVRLRNNENANGGLMYNLSQDLVDGSLNNLIEYSSCQENFRALEPTENSVVNYINSSLSRGVPYNIRAFESPDRLSPSINLSDRLSVVTQKYMRPSSILNDAGEEIRFNELDLVFTSQEVGGLYLPNYLS
ncbi:MAG: hypothetical protein ACI83O_000243 [Patescibacteria group bacterium]|jgi:hypothetical protein